ncbi:hypothetical protein RIF29_27251 [Crotalaria pallida]|uniref:Uncharacterized protein n=1 Tax=Crotalaria pallida TaxID=3830 RepID=A0AAN9I0V3_CROPI
MQRNGDLVAWGERMGDGHLFRNDRGKIGDAEGHEVEVKEEEEKEEKHMEEKEDPIEGPIETFLSISRFHWVPLSRSSLPFGSSLSVPFSSSVSGSSVPSGPLCLRPIRFLPWWFIAPIRSSLSPSHFVPPSVVRLSSVDLRFDSVLHSSRSLPWCIGGSSQPIGASLSVVLDLCSRFEQDYQRKLEKEDNSDNFNDYLTKKSASSSFEKGKQEEEEKGGDVLKKAISARA